ncbi:HlyD family secretion protein [Pelagibacterium xiamenense]|uniref:HlyD family secretion protein n=1 Tax=Pelagibacterium xiamenense TaxID=2901140 RepID=UPI001E5D229A|nr:HlyD family efflux transporter periplasmic adaptor subunit [Pelagibacterium xiamenense]MCD7060660.1 HlyD family efflux transporter periplasmic adaptor subunit [Pelagibacterium xiamenense]
MSHRLRPLLAIVVFAGLAYFSFWYFTRPVEPAVLNGYIEGNTLYLAAPAAAPLRSLAVAAGDRVNAGDPLFSLDETIINAQIAQAEAAIGAAEARLDDARAGERPAELAVLSARRDGAQAAFDEAQTELGRIRELVERGTMAQARLDQAQAAADTAAATLEQVTRELAAARLGARQGQIDAAAANVTQTRAALAEVEARHAQMSPAAPAAGRIDEVYFQVGEWVSANQPVVALLPDDAVHIRFFVPERDLPLYAPGTEVTFACDGCNARMSATVTSVSAEPEFTPPVIYSRDSRGKLVFEVEASPVAAAGLAPGQPVDVLALAHPEAPHEGVDDGWASLGRLGDMVVNGFENLLPREPRAPDLDDAAQAGGEP